MKLREHPSMTCRKAPNWPPMWLGTDNHEDLTDGVAILKHVITDERHPGRCFLVVELNGQGYVGLLEFDDPRFCVRMSKILAKHAGHRIRDIGDTDLVLAS